MALAGPQRDLSIPSERDAEKREIAQRMLALGFNEGGEPFSVYIALWGANNDKRPHVVANGLAMLNEERPFHEILTTVRQQSYGGAS